MKGLEGFQSFLFVTSVLSLTGLAISALFYAFVTDTVYNYGKRNSMILDFFRIIFSVLTVAPLFALIIQDVADKRALTAFFVITCVITFLVNVAAILGKVASAQKEKIKGS